MITHQESVILAQEERYLDFLDERLTKIVGLIRDNIPNASFDPPSYVRVESRPEGHPWHYDWENKHGGTRGWCGYTANILLTDPKKSFTGGGFYFRNTPTDEPIFSYRSLLIYSNTTVDNEHKVDISRGNRRTLLIFLGKKDVPNNNTL